MPLNHVALTVRDREASARFYGGHFGLTERVHEDPRRLILGAPDGSLLALSEGPVPVGLPAGNHFGFELGSTEEVRAARGRLRAAGVPETEWQDEDGFTRVQVSDPDGYGVELFAVWRPGPPRPPRTRWTSFSAEGGKTRTRVLREHGNPDHRARVEHDRHTLLVHLSDEDGNGWTVLGVERATRRTAVAHGRTQLDAAETVFALLYPGG